MAERTPEPGAARQEAPQCARCTHYFITHDPYFPYGCRALNLKSRQPPHREVELAAGMPCQAFVRRQKLAGQAPACG